MMGRYGFQFHQILRYRFLHLVPSYQNSAQKVYNEYNLPKGRTPEDNNVYPGTAKISSSKMFVFCLKEERNAQKVDNSSETVAPHAKQGN